MRTGVSYLAVALTVVAASAVSQALVTRIGVKPVLVAGMGLLTIALLYFSQVSPDGSYLGDLLPGFLLIGVGMGFSFVPISIAALAGVGDREAGLASGLINTSQQIGGALGVALLITVATTRTEDMVASGAAAPEALTNGFGLAFFVAAGFAFASLVLTLVALKRDELDVAALRAAPVPA